jgi:uncharacterized protein
MVKILAMPDSVLLVIAAVFALAGFVKGVVGLGLPTIAMGLLALAMPPVEAAAILVLPSLATNFWQMLAGPHLRPLLRRLWPAMAGVCLGTWAGMGWLGGGDARAGTAALGVVLVLYAASGLAALRLALGARPQRWLGPIVGAATGLLTAATGVFVIPAVPYLAAIGLEKEELVQALGLSFTVSTLALTLNLAVAGAFSAVLAVPTLVALGAAGVGMGVGQALRARLSPAAFRIWFFAGLLVLGGYLVIRSLA